jgi:small conductance mechanosensitive channel
MNLTTILQYPFLEFLIYTVIVLLVSFILVKILYFLINKITKKFEVELTLNYLLKDLAKYSIYILAFLIILSIAGVDINALLVSLGVFGITIGFAARDIISSFVSGMFILADKTVKVGEVIGVNDIKGNVKKLGFRTTTLITPDNLIVTVPNTVLAKNPYINYTFFDKHRIDLNVIIPFNIDIEEFQDFLIKKISDLKWTLKDSPSKVVVVGIVEGGVQLEVSAWGNEYSMIESCRLELANEIRKLINEMQL